MRDTIIAPLSRHLSAALGRPLDIAALDDEVDLSSLGLDSILAITVLVGLAEEFGVDLEDYVESLTAPRSLGNLISIVLMFQEKTLAS
jgi:acyl carrier protein